MPSDDGFRWLLLATTTLYLVSALFVIGGRLRHERRRALFDQIAQGGELQRSEGGFMDAPLSPLLAQTPLRLLERCLYDMQAPEPALTACALALVHRVGEHRLSRRATRAWSRWRRVAAIRALAFSESSAAWPLLARTIRHADGESVRAAVVTLGRVHDVRGAELLVEALSRATQGRAQIAALLEKTPSDISAMLWPLLDDPNPILRYWGASLSARYAGRREVEERLRAVAGDSNASVRRAVVDALGAGECAGSLPTMLKLMDDAVPFVRAHAVLAVGRLGLVRLAPVISLKLSDADWSIRDAAKQVLESYGRDAEPAVFDRLSDDDPFARDSAAEILQNLGTFERLLLAEASGPPDPQRLVRIRTLVAETGPPVWEAVLANLPAEVRERVAPLVQGLAQGAGDGRWRDAR